MIQVQNLRKRFDKLQAVDDVSFNVERGEIYGLLGPNGAGKTTILSMIAGLLQPDEGTISLDGVELASDPIGVKGKLGVVPQETALYQELSARENLRFWAGMYGLAGGELNEAVKDALELVGLSGRPCASTTGLRATSNRANCCSTARTCWCWDSARSARASRRRALHSACK